MFSYLFPTLLSSLATKNHSEIPHATESRTSFPRTARKEAPSLAILWWQQAAWHVPHPTPPPQGPERAGDGAGARALLCHGVLGTRSPRLHRTVVRCPLTGPEASVTQPQQCQWVYTCVTRAWIWPHGCRPSLWSRSHSGLSHTPEIFPDFDRSHTRRLTK